MKRSIFIAVLGVGMVSAVSSYGQGQVFFANYYSSTQTSGLTYAAGSPGGIAGLGVGPEISVELLKVDPVAVAVFCMDPPTSGVCAAILNILPLVL